MGVKEAILILFKRALEIPSEPCLCYSILTWADTCHSSLTSGQLFCSDFCPTSLSSLCPRLRTPLKAGPGQAEWGALATLSECSAELFQELLMPSTQCNSSMALSDLPDAPRRKAEALNGIRGSMAYSLHSLLGVGGWEGGIQDFAPRGLKDCSRRLPSGPPVQGGQAPLGLKRRSHSFTWFLDPQHSNSVFQTQPELVIHSHCSSSNLPLASRKRRHFSMTVQLQNTFTSQTQGEKITKHTLYIHCLLQKNERKPSTQEHLHFINQILIQCNVAYGQEKLWLF